MADTPQIKMDESKTIRPGPVKWISINTFFKKIECNLNLHKIGSSTAISNEDEGLDEYEDDGQSGENGYDREY